MTTNLLINMFQNKCNPLEVNQFTIESHPCNKKTVLTMYSRSELIIKFYRAIYCGSVVLTVEGGAVRDQWIYKWMLCYAMQNRVLLKCTEMLCEYWYMHYFEIWSVKRIRCVIGWFTHYTLIRIHTANSTLEYQRGYGNDQTNYEENGIE